MEYGNDLFQHRFLEEKDSQYTHSMELYGNDSLGYYYINVYVGSPPQRQSVIIDTGSQITTFPCTDCKDNCGHHLDKQFNITASSTVEKMVCGQNIEEYHCKNGGSCQNDESPCGFSVHYTEGSSLQGYYLKDKVVIGDEYQQYYNNAYQITDSNLAIFIQKEQFPFIFGCTTRETNLFKTQEADGIMGLGRQSNDTSHIPNLVDWNFQSHHSEKSVFSICFSLNGGFLSVGGPNKIKHLSISSGDDSTSNPQDKTGTHYVQLHGNNQYNINVNKLVIGGIDTGLSQNDFNSGQGTFVDSGTTLFYSRPFINGKMKSAIQSYCNLPGNCHGQFKNCYKYSHSKHGSHDSFYAAFPEIIFSLDGDFEYVWTPQDYMYLEGVELCFPFLTIGSRVILGGLWMRNYDIIFDRQNNQIGFSKANCSKSFINQEEEQEVVIEEPDINPNEVEMVEQHIYKDTDVLDNYFDHSHLDDKIISNKIADKETVFNHDHDHEDTELDNNDTSSNNHESVVSKPNQPHNVEFDNDKPFIDKNKKVEDIPNNLNNPTMLIVVIFLLVILWFIFMFALCLCLWQRISVTEEVNKQVEMYENDGSYEDNKLHISDEIDVDDYSEEIVDNNDNSSDDETYEEEQKLSA